MNMLCSLERRQELVLFKPCLVQDQRSNLKHHIELIFDTSVNNIQIFELRIICHYIHYFISNQGEPLLLVTRLFVEDKAMLDNMSGGARP